jgi:phospholipid/cholesterol/gamma-HCH transport system ATP-binding protein
VRATLPVGSVVVLDMNSIPAIEVRHVSLGFEEKRILSDVSFQVESGGTLVLLGVTASGKSVLLKLILGLFKPDDGQIFVEGQDLTALSESALQPIRKRMGIVFQEGALFDSISVYENVAFRLHEEGLRDEVFIESRVREMLRFVEMEQAIDKMPSELSGGMRRRVSIARAIISEPAIMLYDSPTAGLDPVTSHTIDVLITKLRDVQHVSSVVVTHRLQDAYVLANYIFSSSEQGLIRIQNGGRPGQVAPARFLVLRDGGVYFQGMQQDLVHTRDPYLKSFLP